MFQHNKFNCVLFFYRKDSLDVFNTVQEMQRQRALMFPSVQQYHDIFRCLRDEISGEGRSRRATKVEIITEKDGNYISQCTTEDHDYWDLDEMDEDGYDCDYS